LAQVFENLYESLEDVRLTGLFVIPYEEEEDDDENLVDNDDNDTYNNDSGGSGDNHFQQTHTRKDDPSQQQQQQQQQQKGVLDPVIQACVHMTNLKSLAISLKQDSLITSASSTTTTSTTATGLLAAAPLGGGRRRRGGLPVVLVPAPSANTATVTTTTTSSSSLYYFSKTCLQKLCQTSTTLQDLSLRAMQLTNDTCETIAQALSTGHDSCFLTSLDIRQNPNIGEEGYRVILQALERNCHLWCTVMVVRILCTTEKK
jgi:hypothetical protein